MYSWHPNDRGHDRRSCGFRCIVSGDTRALSLHRGGGHPCGLKLCRMAGKRTRIAAFGGVKILLDMCLTPKWREPLENLGHEVKHWSEVGARNAPDTSIMNWALENDYIVFTNDLDYGISLSSSGAAGPSVIQARGGDVRPSVILASVAEALSDAESELKAGALVTVDARRHRVSVLPIRRVNR